MEEFEVDKAYESGIELHKRQHHPEIHVTWHLHIHKNRECWRERGRGRGGGGGGEREQYLLAILVRSDPRDGLALYLSLVVDTFNRQEHLQPSEG